MKSRTDFALLACLRRALTPWNDPRVETLSDPTTRNDPHHGTLENPHGPPEMSSLITFLLLLPVFSRDDPHDTPPDMKNNSRRTTQVYVFGEEFRRMFGRFDQVEDEFVFEEPQDI